MLGQPALLDGRTRLTLRRCAQALKAAKAKTALLNWFCTATRARLLAVPLPGSDIRCCTRCCLVPDSIVQALLMLINRGMHPSLPTRDAPGPAPLLTNGWRTSVRHDRSSRAQVVPVC